MDNAGKQMTNVCMDGFTKLLIDLQKGIFELNGKPLPQNCFELSVEFTGGVWRVEYTCHEYGCIIEQRRF